MQRTALPLLIGFLALLLAVGIRVADPVLIQQARFAVFDTYQRLAPRPYRDAPVRVVDIDDESLRRFGQFPWPRTLVADLVVRLQQLGAATIAFDIVFPEPDRTSPAQFASLLPDDGTTSDLRRELLALPDNDGVLAQAIAAAPVVLGFSMSSRDNGTRPAVKPGFAFAGSDPAAFVANYPGAIANLPAFEAAAKGNGSFGIGEQSGATGIVRQVPLLQAVGGQLYPSLSVEALRVAQGAGTLVVRSSDASGQIAVGRPTGVTAIKIGAIDVPVTDTANMWMHYTETAPVRMVPAWEVLEATAATAAAVAEKVQGRIVLIGTSASGLLDLRSTPLHAFEPGVLIHAQALEQMILGDFLRRPAWAVGVELVALVALGAVVLLLLPRIGPLWSASMMLGAVGLGVAVSWLAYARGNLLFDPVYPGIAVLIVYFAMTAVLFFRTEQQRRYVRQAFSRYLAPALVDRLADSPEQLVLGGEIRELTLMFSDIRGFTTISERMDPQELTRFINEFLTPMSGIILDEGGTIDKYIGDCIMAFWNAPLSVDGHPRRSCRAALAMRAQLAELNEAWRAQSAQAGRAFSDISIGIGVNTGSCCVGNMGSQQRLEYSVLGDTVNLASRLEGQSKAYGVDIVIGETTQAGAPDLAALELDLIRVKGKNQPVRIFTLLGDETVAESPAFRTLRDAHDAMLQAYRAQRWDEADATLTRLRGLGGDGLAHLYDLYAERVLQFRDAAPGEAWDGVHIAQTK